MCVHFCGVLIRQNFRCVMRNFGTACCPNFSKLFFCSPGSKAQSLKFLCDFHDFSSRTSCFSEVVIPKTFAQGLGVCIEEGRLRGENTTWLSFLALVGWKANCVPWISCWWQMWHFWEALFGGISAAFLHRLENKGQKLKLLLAVYCTIPSRWFLSRWKIGDPQLNMHSSLEKGPPVPTVKRILAFPQMNSVSFFDIFNPNLHLTFLLALQLPFQRRISANSISGPQFSSSWRRRATSTDEAKNDEKPEPLICPLIIVFRMKTFNYRYLSEASHVISDSLTTRSHW